MKNIKEHPIYKEIEQMAEKCYLMGYQKAIKNMHSVNDVLIEIPKDCSYGTMVLNGRRCKIYLSSLTETCDFDGIEYELILSVDSDSIET